MIETTAKDRVGFLERLGRLAGGTTFREAGQGGGVPYAARMMTTENALALSLALARRNPRDVGPWIAYAMATKVEDHRQEIITWLADKLIAGTQHVGKRNSKRMLGIAATAYTIVVRGEKAYRTPRTNPRDFEILLSIGIGWLWTSVESAVERAEYALRAPEGRLARARATVPAKAA